LLLMSVMGLCENLGMTRFDLFKDDDTFGKNGEINLSDLRKYKCSK